MAVHSVDIAQTLIRGRLVRRDVSFLEKVGMVTSFCFCLTIFVAFGWISMKAGFASTAEGVVATIAGSISLTGVYGAFRCLTSNRLWSMQTDLSSSEGFKALQEFLNAYGDRIEVRERELLVAEYVTENEQTRKWVYFFVEERRIRFALLSYRDDVAVPVLFVDWLLRRDLRRYLHKRANSLLPTRR